MSSIRYTVEVHRRAEKFLRSLTDAALYKRLRDCIDSLGTEPRPAGVVRLAATELVYRVRVGDYRILYQIQDEVLRILVIEIGHRREVYR